MPVQFSRCGTAGVIEDEIDAPLGLMCC